MAPLDKLGIGDFPQDTTRNHLNISKITGASKVEALLQAEVHHLHNHEHQPFLHSKTMLSLQSHVYYLGLTFLIGKKSILILALPASLG